MGRERLHVRPHFRQHHLGHPAIDPGNCIQAIDLSHERARLLLDFPVQLSEQLFLLGELFPQQLQQEPMVLGSMSFQGLAFQPTIAWSGTLRSC
jgi:hypothetical protein